jgi:hypothetical protein
MSTSYTLHFSDPANTSTIEVLGVLLGPGKNNYSTSLDLVGPGYTNYGQDTAQNFLKLLENFAGPNPPVNSIKGQLWYDTSNPNRAVLRINNGSITSNRWPTATGIYQQTSDPDLTYTSNVKTGDIWVDTKSNQLKIRNSSNNWITVGPTLDTGSSKTGPEVSVLESNTGSFYPVVLNWANGKVVEIVSYNNFTPKSVIDGFSAVRAGTNLTSRIPARYNGIAESAASLYLSPGVTLNASNVLKNRSQTSAQVHTGTFVVESIAGLFVRNPTNNESIRTYSTNTEAFISYSDVSSSAFRIGLGTGTDSVSFIRFKSNGNVGVNTLNPTSTLEVTGTGKFSGNVLISSTTEVTTPATGALVVSGGATFGKTVNVNTLTVTTGATIKEGIIVGTIGGSGTALLPATTGTYDLGSSDNYFDSIYVQNIRSGTGRIEIYGAVSTATQLEDPHTISIVGNFDTVSPASFNGTDDVEINAVANTSLITGTTLTTVTSSTQHLLICDTADPSELKHIGKLDFLSDVYSVLFQPGMIIPYTTSTLTGVVADNFLLCDGSSYYAESTVTNYLNLWNVIGNRYGDTYPYFSVPNLTTATVANGGYPIHYIIKR